VELQKYPETEQEYWEAIEALGAEQDFLTRTQNRIETYAGREGKSASTNFWPDVAEMAALSTTLANELSEKFGIILPKDCPKPDDQGVYPKPPEGKRWYWPWYKEKKEQWLRAEFDKLICSACPFATFDMSFVSRIPCEVFLGSLYQLKAPHLCAMIDTDPPQWAPAKLIAEIYQAGGDETLLHFLEKRRALTPPEP